MILLELLRKVRDGIARPTLSLQYVEMSFVGPHRMHEMRTTAATDDFAACCVCHCQSVSLSVTRLAAAPCKKRLEGSRSVQTPRGTRNIVLEGVQITVKA